ncbi:hypothetical protein ACQ4M3_39465 [Leptolyngbya sp. AN03gr2]|uniref:hypothetical protein n=1 Tax=unclassified Leptolyngbya TaxID=2650499 RepID=UPI003D320309
MNGKPIDLSHLVKENEVPEVPATTVTEITAPLPIVPVEPREVPTVTTSTPALKVKVQAPQIPNRRKL